MSDLSEIFRAIGFSATTIAEAMDDDDHIAGVLASRGFLDNIEALPEELRADIITAARGGSGG